MSDEKARMFNALRIVYPLSRFVVLAEVANSTGWARQGFCDALAVSLLPSGAFALHGFEIKLARSDWLRELKRPEKSERFKRFCTRWYLLCTEGVAQASELPPGWGMLVLRDGALHTAKRAPKLTPEPVTAGMWAGLVRRAFAQSAANSMQPCRLPKPLHYNCRAGGLCSRSRLLETAQ